MRTFNFAAGLFRLGLMLTALTCRSAPNDTTPPNSQSSKLEKRWLFIWSDLTDPKEVDGVIGRFPAAKESGYNGVVFSPNVVASKTAVFKEAAEQNGLDLIAVVMGGGHDRNDVEGVPVKDALFVAHDGRAALEPDNPTRLVNADFDEASGNHFKGWGFQDDEGVTTFADHDVVHSGKTSLRMQDIGKNQYQHCRISQSIALRPYRQYRISFWLKTENLSPADAEVKVLSTDTSQSISFQTIHVEKTQDWKQYDVVFNSFNHDKGVFYAGTWSGNTGKMWWDDLRISEIGLVNVLRRPGCPVTVRGEDGIAYEEGRDFARIVDPMLHPWIPYHDPPLIKLTASSRIPEGARLRVSYYHSIIVHEDRVNFCLSEPKVFADWEADVKQASDLFHPAGFFMSHDEIRVMNQCALCRSKGMTAGELLAWNVHEAAGMIRKIRPDAEIWVWSDMFDPLHNAVDHYYAVNGTLAGSWKGLDKGIGIVNWNGGLKGKNCQFFEDLGLRQILSGYYDSDEDGAAIAEWLGNTKTVLGIIGAMYTTWEGKYGAMQPWARQAWGAGMK
jgi:hypothetical protein